MRTRLCRLLQCYTLSFTSLIGIIALVGEVRFLPIAVLGPGLYSPLAILITGEPISSVLLVRLLTHVMYTLLPPEIKSGNAAAPSARAVPVPAT